MSLKCSDGSVSHRTTGKWNSRAAAIALAVAAAAPVVMLNPEASALTELDRALVLLSDQAKPTDPQLLAQGIELYNKSQYEEAQVTLQQAKAEGLSQAEQARLAETLTKVEAALNARQAARANFEQGEAALAANNADQAISHYRAAIDSKYADAATRAKAQSQLDVAQAMLASAPKQDLKATYKEAVGDFKAGRFEQARAKFAALDAAGYKGGLLDRKPASYLRDIDQKLTETSATVVTEVKSSVEAGTAQAAPAPEQTSVAVVKPQPKAPAEAVVQVPAPAVVEVQPAPQPQAPAVEVQVQPEQAPSVEVQVQPEPVPTVEVQAQPTPRELYELGVAEYKQRNYAAARELFQAAQAANYKPGLFRTSPAKYLEMIEDRQEKAAVVVVPEVPATGETAVIVETPATQTPSGLEATARVELLRQQQRQYEAGQLVQRAEQARRENRLQEAYVLYSEAAKLDPTNQAAVTGAVNLRVLTTGGVEGGMLEAQIERIRVLKQAIEYSFQRNIEEARQAIAANNFDQAQAAIDAARVARDSDPTVFSQQELSQFNSTIANTQAALNRATEATATVQQRTAAEQAAEEAARRERIRIEEERRTVQALVRTAKQLVYEGQYSQALGVINQILAIDPTNDYAVGVKRLVQDYATIQQQRYYREKYDRELEKQLNRTEESKIPYMDLMVYPENWPDISELRDREVLEERHGAAGDAQALAQLERRLPELRFDNVGFAEVVDFLRDVTGANIYVNWRALEAAGVDKNATVTARLRDVKFSKALSTILADVGGGAVQLAYTIDEGVITISTADELNRNVTTEVYDIRDLLVVAPDFQAPPNFGFGTGGGGGESGSRSGGSGNSGGLFGGGGGGGGGGFGGGGGGGGGGQGPAQSTQDLVEEITTLIQETVDRDSWTLNGGPGSLKFLSGQLIVTQTPDNQRRLQGLLDKLRETRAIQVSIETRFLQVERNFLEDIGVDLDFVFNIENPENFSPIIVSQNSAAFTANPSTPLTSLGAPPGIQVAGSFLDDFQVNFLIRATQAAKNSTSLTAPRVTVFNGQPAYLVVATEQSYVSDLEADTGDGVGLYDPEIDIVRTGVVLFVQPTVSADRKYVTMNLQPTVTQLIALRTFNVAGVNTGTGGGGGGLPGSITAAIQEPELQVTTVATLVSVPDGGTLLLGGQTLAGEVEIEEGVPILSKIPIVKRLFTNRSSAKDERVLLILVKPTIIIQREVEQQQFPLLSSGNR